MTTRATAKATIRATLDQLKQLLSGPKPTRLSESDTKANFIDQYIDALGYRGLADITREYYVKNSQEFVDYVLKSGDRLLVAVEAKALQHDLTDKAAAQLVQYCAIEGIEWCVLTNGRELRLYNQYLRGALEAKLLFKLDLMAYNSDAEYDAIFEQLWLLSKESMTTPSGIRTWMEHQRLDRVLRQLLLDPTSGAVRGLRRALADEGVAVTAEGLAQWFRAQLASPVTPLLPQQLAPQSPTRTVERPAPPAPSPTGDGQYWVLPAGNTKDTTAEESLRAWLSRRMWGMRASTPHRQNLRAADRVCFYASGGWRRGHRRGGRACRPGPAARGDARATLRPHPAAL